MSKLYRTVSFGEIDRLPLKDQKDYVGHYIFASGDEAFVIEGNSHSQLTHNRYTELDLLKYLYKKDPTPELMAAILELSE